MARKKTDTYSVKLNATEIEEGKIHKNCYEPK